MQSGVLLLTVYLERHPRYAGPDSSVDDYRPSSPYVPYVPPEGSSTGGTINAALLASPSAAPRGHSALPYPPGDAQAPTSYNQRAAGADTLIRDVQTTD